MSLFELLTCYGLTFGLMNKTSWIQNRLQFTKKLLSCSYCTGFHVGWVVYLSSLKKISMLSIDVTNLLTYSFASAAFCYVLDTALIKIEED